MSRISSLLLALLVFWGMSGRAFAAAFCPMFQSRVAPTAAAPLRQHDCCAGRKAPKAPDKKSQAECCCKQDSLKGAPGKTATLDSFGIYIATLPDQTAELLELILEHAEPVHFYSGVSPPLAGRSPVCGRAPPMA